MSEDSDRISKMEKTVEQHSLILRGDDESYPPKPGVMHILKQISDQISHPESGNAAIYQSVRQLKEQDQRRISFFGGARWVVVTLIGILAFLLGTAVQYFHR